MVGLEPTLSDAEIPDNMTPQLDLNVDYQLIWKTPAKNVDSTKEDLNRKRRSNLDAQLQFKDVDLSTLNQYQWFAANTIQKNMDSQTLIIFMEGPGTGKSAVVKAMTNIVNETVQNITSVIRLGTTGTASFVISGVNYHSVLCLPINSPFNNLNGAKLQHPQQSLDGINLIIIDEISMTGKKMMYHIYRRLWQSSGRSL